MPWEKNFYKRALATKPPVLSLPLDFLNSSLSDLQKELVQKTRDQAGMNKTGVIIFFFWPYPTACGGFPGGSVGKESTCNAGDPGLIPGWGRSPGEGNGNPLQYSCLENPRDRGAWQATVHGVTRVGHD